MALSAAAVLVVAVAAGCSRAPEVAAASQGATTECKAAADAFPDTVSQMTRIDGVAATSAAAWGDPAIIARCGVPALTPTAVECLEVDGVGWIPQALSDGTRFTTFGTDPALEVLIPKAYAPEGLLLPAFTAAAKTLPTNDLKCR